jgi:hypothetical protein
MKIEGWFRSFKRHNRNQFCSLSYLLWWRWFLHRLDMWLKAVGSLMRIIWNPDLKYKTTHKPAKQNCWRDLKFFGRFPDVFYSPRRKISIVWGRRRGGEGQQCRQSVGSQFKEFLKHGHRIYNIGILCRENQTKCMPLTGAYLHKAGHEALGRYTNASNNNCCSMYSETSHKGHHWNKDTSVFLCPKYAFLM